jgi:hypothetical protein
MALSEQAHLVRSLLAKGQSVKGLATLFGVSPRYITQARDAVEKVGKGGKVSKGKGQNLLPALRQLNEKGKVSPAQLPERRKTKSGQVAKTRKGVTKTTTAKGTERTITSVKKGPATLRKSIQDAASKGQSVKWTIGGKVRTKSDPKKGHKGYVTDSTPGGWNAQTLLDRIDKPLPGDDWSPGDINAALAEIAVRSQHGSVTSITAITETTLWTE